MSSLDIGARTRHYESDCSLMTSLSETDSFSFAPALDVESIDLCPVVVLGEPKGADGGGKGSFFVSRHL